MSDSYVSEHEHRRSQSHSRHNRNANGTQTTNTSPTSPIDVTSPNPGDDTEAQVREHDYAQDAGSDDDMDEDDDDDDRHSFDSADSVEEQWHLLDEEVTTLVADVHDLALYSKLNITGFMKILKVGILCPPSCVFRTLTFSFRLTETRCKAFSRPFPLSDPVLTSQSVQKQTPTPLKERFINQYLEKRPFYKYNWDGLIVKLSNLYNVVRTRGHPVLGDSSAGGSQSAFVRQTTKYWVHQDNLVPLKLAILRHLPVLGTFLPFRLAETGDEGGAWVLILPPFPSFAVFNSDKEFEDKDAGTSVYPSPQMSCLLTVFTFSRLLAITSIYFDNEDLELYLGRLEKTEGAEAVRLRWYGDTDVTTVRILLPLPVLFPLTSPPFPLTPNPRSLLPSPTP